MRKLPQGLLTPIKRLFWQSYPLLRLVLPRGHRPYRFAGGIIYLDITESVMMLKRVLGRFERKKTALLNRFLGDGMTFVDVGGNHGYFSLIAAGLVGQTGRVFTFEPEPGNCCWLRRSIERNGYTNIKVCEMAIGQSDGQANLYLAEKSGWHTLVSGARQTTHGCIAVAKRALDSVMLEEGMTSADVIKIDVEGAELEVIEGAAKTIRASKKIVLLLDVHPSLGVMPAEVLDCLHSLDLVVHTIDGDIVGDQDKAVLAECIAVKGITV